MDHCKIKNKKLSVFVPSVETVETIIYFNTCVAHRGDLDARESQGAAVGSLSQAGGHLTLFVD